MLGVGLLATVFISLHVKEDIEQEAVRQFAFTCDQVTLKIQERLDAYAQILRGGTALFAASREVERSQWQIYVEALHAERTFLGVQGIGFAQVIPADQLAAHIARIRSEGFPEYTVRPSGERAVYTSIVYLEPFRDRNLRAFGFDMYSEPVRRTAMEQARDTGEAALSGKVELVQETGTDVQAGILMYVPVYRNGMPKATVGQKRAALVGWVYSPYRMNDLMAGVLQDWVYHDGKIIDLTIFDGLQATSATLLFDSKPIHSPDLPSLFHQRRTIDFNGHQWLLAFAYTKTPTVMSYAPALAALAGGFALSGLLFGLMRSVVNTQANAVRIADKLTEEIRNREELLKESDAFKLTVLNALPAQFAVLIVAG
jgi:CHASE1-domain containing sensor protein